MPYAAGSGAGGRPVVSLVRHRQPPNDIAHTPKATGERPCVCTCSVVPQSALLTWAPRVRVVLLLVVGPQIGRSTGSSAARWVPVMAGPAAAPIGAGSAEEATRSVPVCPSRSTWAREQVAGVVGLTESFAKAEGGLGGSDTMESSNHRQSRLSGGKAERSGTYAGDHGRWQTPSRDLPGQRNKTGALGCTR
jgi:hypothetical protein